MIGRSSVAKEPEREKKERCFSSVLIGRVSAVRMNWKSEGQDLDDDDSNRWLMKKVHGKRKEDRAGEENDLMDNCLPEEIDSPRYKICVAFGMVHCHGTMLSESPTKLSFPIPPPSPSPLSFASVACFFGGDGLNRSHRNVSPKANWKSFEST